MSKTAMIWGAGGGIGRALLRRLKADGWTTLAMLRHPDADLEGADHTFLADAARPVMAAHAVQQAAFEVDEVSLWIYAAGDISSTRVADMKAADWQRIIDANLSGPFHATRASLPLLAEDAHLFYLGAVSERLQLPGLSAYAAAKAGLEAWATAFAKEERKRRVTLVRPGAVATPFWEKVPLRLPRDAATPAQVAERILQAYADGTTGRLDLTH